MRVGEISHAQNKFRILSVERTKSTLYYSRLVGVTVIVEFKSHSIHFLLLMLSKSTKHLGGYGIQHPPIKILEGIPSPPLLTLMG